VKNPAHTDPSLDTGDVEQAMAAFAAISSDLVVGFEALSARAEHVEAELSIANAELAAKVEEVDAVKQHLEAIVGSLPTGVVVRDSNGTITSVNEAARAILGLTDDELVGQSEIPGLQPAVEDVETRTFELANGERKTIATRLSPVTNAEGDVTGSVEILDDRTEISRMQQRVHQLDKMAALGTMAGGIAHEIRNPMNAVRGFAALLRNDMEQDTTEWQWATHICDGVQEADAIITSILSFARPEQLERETIDAKLLVDDAIHAVQRDLATRTSAATWKLTSDVEAHAFVGDRIKLRQALRNLIANAVDAQPEGGAVHVELLQDSGDLVFQVSDAGPGISAQEADHITEPFYTKRVGNSTGTGLGLALVHTIAQLHGGRFEAAPTASKLGGATVLFRIPEVSNS